MEKRPLVGAGSKCRALPVIAYLMRRSVRNDSTTHPATCVAGPARPFRLAATSYRQILWMPPESGGLLFFAVGELYARDDVLNQCVAAQSSPAFLGCLAQLEHHRQARAA